MSWTHIRNGWLGPAHQWRRKVDELEMTVETLIDLDEPEAMLETLKRAAKRKKGQRWQRLAQALQAAADELEALNETDKRAEPDDSEPKPA